ncbi:hypothetical protein F5Y17DRAFT_423085 [Xylariaceae sp. FL0594]|nr:hypothetical protein F5Y17DRAFT_423085 [Xylariaceae sp. FL0594]
MAGTRRSLFALLGGAASVAATSVVYVSDLQIFTVLAPCAQSAVFGIIDYQTVQGCPDSATGLQSCICSKNAGNNYATIGRSISDSISYTCGQTATEDQASASTVLSAYCNQNKIITFPSPSITVQDYVTDLPAFQNLAPCAASGVSQAVLQQTDDRCQADPSLLATCACDKGQNSEYVSSQISSSVKYYCSSHALDVASAQAVFQGYCGLAHGTTSFPDTTDPPGQMTYYITALDEYSALGACAKTAVSNNVLSQTRELCPPGPQALASCACLRSEMYGSISSSITSTIREYCSSAGSDEVRSAIGVLDLYCSAAKALTTIAHVTQSVSQPTPSPKPHSGGAQQTSSQAGSAPTATPSSTGPDGAETGAGAGSGDGSTQKATSNTAVIAGAVAGSVIGTGLIAAVAFLLYRRRKKAEANAANPPIALADEGKPELDSTSVAPGTAGSLSPSMQKLRMDDVSPVSAISGPNSPYGSELAAYPPRTTELPERNFHPSATHHEALSQQIYEAPGQHQAPPPSSGGQGNAGGMGWQSGPVPNAYEMDGGYTGPKDPHAR